MAREAVALILEIALPKPIRAGEGGRCLWGGALKALCGEPVFALEDLLDWKKAY